MRYPAYRLNPGDMFQVDPEMVMMATGQKKRPERTKKGRAKARSGSEEEDGAEPVEEEAAEAEAEEEAKPAAATNQDPDTTDAPEAEPVDMKPTKRQILGIMQQAREVLQEKGLSGGQKQKLRAFIKDSRNLLSRAGRQNAITPQGIASELTKLVRELKPPSDSEAEESPSTTATTTHEPLSWRNDANEKDDELFSSFSPEVIKGLNIDERHALAQLIRDEEDNPYDPSKPYQTPWRPREYMSPFAFIPQYLEVNQKICAAVYLRHPVARRGSAEVPTPYPVTVSQLAFNWYLRRR